MEVFRFEVGNKECGIFLMYNDVFLYSVNERVYSSVSPKDPIITLNSPIQSLLYLDFLIIQTKTGIVAIDLENNIEIWRCALENEKNILCVVSWGYSKLNHTITDVKPVNFKKSLILASGNCVKELDASGNEMEFWEILSDEVTAMTTTGLDDDEIIISTIDDTVIRLKQNDILFSFHLPGVIKLAGSKSEKEYGYIGYSLWDGSVGVCTANKKVLWQASSSRHVSDIIIKMMYPSSQRSSLLCGYSDGTYEFRDIETGDIQFSSKFNKASAVSFVILNDGTVAVCCQNGHIKGYKQCSIQQKVTSQPLKLYSLMQKKIELEVKLKKIKDSPICEADGDDTGYGIIIPSSTDVELSVNFDKMPIVDIASNNDTESLGVIVEGNFGEKKEFKFKKLRSSEKNIKVEFPQVSDNSLLNIETFIAAKHGNFCKIISKTLNVKKFNGFKYISSFNYKEWMAFHGELALENVSQWIVENFQDSDRYFHEWKKDNLINLHLVHFSGYHLGLFAEGGTVLKFKIFGPFEICSNVFLSFLKDLNVCLKTFLHFPQISNEITELEIQMEGIKLSKSKINMEISNCIHSLKEATVEAESRRCVGMVEPKLYSYIIDINLSLHDLELKKQGLDNEIIKIAKRIGEIVNNATNLRIGEDKSAILKSCREALKNGEISHLKNYLRLEENPP